MVVSKHSVKSLRLNRLLQIDSSPTPGRHHYSLLLLTVVQMCRGYEGIRGDGVVNLWWKSADGTDNKAAIVPNQRRINRIPFSPPLSEWPPVFFSAFSARVGNSISVFSCSSFWHLLEAGGRRDGRDVPVIRRQTWTGLLVWAIKKYSIEVLKLKSRFEHAAFVCVGQCKQVIAFVNPKDNFTETLMELMVLCRLLHKAPKNRLCSWNKNAWQDKCVSDWSVICLP